MDESEQVDWFAEKRRSKNELHSYARVFGSSLDRLLGRLLEQASDLSRITDSGLLNVNINLGMLASTTNQNKHHTLIMILINGVRDEVAARRVRKERVISFVVVLLALLSVVISFVLGLIGAESNSQWQDAQLDVLKGIEQAL